MVPLTALTEPAGWKCHFCDKGIAKDQWDAASGTARRRAKFDHRASDHKFIPRATWVKRQQPAQGDPVRRAKRRALNLNQSLAKTAKMPPESASLDRFMWPVWCAASKGLAARLKVFRAHRCTKCMQCFYNNAAVKVHNCRPVSAGKAACTLKKRLATLPKLKEKLKGSGISPEDFDSMAEGAKRAWSGLPLHS